MEGKLWKLYIFGTMTQVPLLASPMVLRQSHSTVLVLHNDH